MTVLITLTSAGTDTGPFSLYSNVDGFITPFETGVAKATLEAGYTSSLVPNFTSSVRIKSVGVCTNYIDVVIAGVTTTTTSTTTTTTPVSIPTLVNPNTCFPGSPSGEISIIGGTSGDNILLKVYYSGQVGTDGASASVSAHAGLNSVDATPVCYSANTGSYSFNLTVNVPVTLTGSTITLPTSMYYRNGTSFILYNKYIQVIEVNGIPVSGDQLSTVCSGNDAGPGC